MQTQNNTALNRRNNAMPQKREERTLVAPVDVYENDEEILILADFPGVNGESIQVRLDGSELTLEGRQDGANAAVLRRSFQVPTTIDGARVTAEMNAGVLTVRLPKREDCKPRRIEVKAG